MAAIITPDFRRKNAKRLIDEILEQIYGETGFNYSYYVGVGRPQAWSNSDTPESLTGSFYETQETMGNLISMKRVDETIDSNTAVGRLIPRIEWVSGRTFKEYDISDITTLYATVTSGVTTFPAYCVTDDNIYLCTTSGSGASTVKPTHTSGVVTGGDGYGWTFLCTRVSNTELDTPNFVHITDSTTLGKLPSWYVGIGVNFASSDLFTNTKYRQVSLVRVVSSSVLEDSQGDPVVVTAKSMVVAAADVTESNRAVGTKITQTGASTGRIAYTEVDGSDLIVYYTQRANTDAGNIDSFDVDGTVTFGEGGTADTNVDLSAGTASKHDRGSDGVPVGSVLFVENRYPITHASNQVEEIRLVIQF